MSNAVLDPDVLPGYQRARRARILEAATALLRSGEYDTIEVRDVAKAADVSLTTVYRYFPSKETLFGYVFAGWASGYSPTGEAGSVPTASTQEQIRASMRRALRGYERFPQMVRLLMMLESSTDPRTRAIHHEFAELNVGCIVDSLHTTDAAVATAIIETAYSVMNTRLRAWMYGQATIRQVHKAVQQCLDLIFCAPPLST